MDWQYLDDEIKRMNEDLQFQKKTSVALRAEVFAGHRQVGQPSGNDVISTHKCHEVGHTAVAQAWDKDSINKYLDIRMI